MGEGLLEGLTRQYRNLYIVSLGASPEKLGFITSLAAIVRSVISVPLGWMIDKSSVKNIMLLGMMLEIITPLAFFLAQNWQGAIVAVLLASLSWPIISMIQSIVLASSLKSEGRATGFGIISMVSAISGIFSPMIAAYIVSEHGGITIQGIKPLYLIQFLGLVPMCLWVYINLEEPTRRKRKEDSILHQFNVLFKTGIGVKYWILLSCLDMFSFNIITPFMMVYAVKIKEATPFIVGAMGTTSTCLSILFMIPVGRAADRIGRKKVLYLGLIPFYGWILSLLFAPNPGWLVLTGALQGVLWSTFPLWSMIPLELVPKDQMGIYSGVKQMFNSITSIPAPILGGILWTWIDPAFPFLIGIIFETIAIALVDKMPETLRARQTIKEE